MYVDGNNIFVSSFSIELGKIKSIFMSDAIFVYDLILGENRQIEIVFVN